MLWYSRGAGEEPEFITSMRGVPIPTPVPSLSLSL